MRSIALALVLLAFPGAAVLAQRAGSLSASRMDTTVAVPRDGRIEVSVPAGDITITGWDRDAARVVGTSEGGALQLEWSGSTLALSQQAQRRHSGATRVELSVPRDAQVSIRTFAGDVIVRGVAGRVSADVTSGSVDVAEISGGADLTVTSGDVRGRALAGRIAAATTHGNIELSDVRGEIDATTTSGAVRLRDIRSGAVKAGALNGNVEFTGALEAGGHYTFNAHSGNVVMEVPESASAAFRLQTFNGHFQTDIPLTLGAGGLRRGAPVSFTLGAGEATVSATTFSGNIIIRRAQRQNR